MNYSFLFLKLSSFFDPGYLGFKVDYEGALFLFQPFTEEMIKFTRTTMTSWCSFMRKPSRFEFSNTLKDLIQIEGDEGTKCQKNIAYWLGSGGVLRWRVGWGNHWCCMIVFSIYSSCITSFFLLVIFYLHFVVPYPHVFVSSGFTTFYV